jgi:HPt (histidine-containing phosphotransfer) domain-containing protein
MLQVFINQIKEFFDQMDESIEKNDWDSIYFLIHKMKSSVEVIGILAVKDVLEKLEVSSNEKRMDELRKNYQSMRQLLNGYSASI